MRVFTLCLAVVLCAHYFAESAMSSKLDDKSTDGTWQLVSAELAGESLPAEAIKSIKMILKNGTYTVYAESEDRGTVQVDTSKSPATLDITGTEGPNKGKTFLAIYELKDNRMKVCYDLSGKSRPTEFKTKAGTLLYLAEYEKKE